MTMHRPILPILLSALLLAAATVWTSTAQAVDARAQITLKDNTRITGWVQQSNDNGILFTDTEGVRGTGYPFGNLADISFLEKGDIMKEARAAYADKDLEKSAQLFAKIADDYVSVVGIPDNFAAEARFYHVESLRLLGQYDKMAAALATPTGQAIPSKLDEYYQPKYKMFLRWVMMAEGNFDALKNEVATFQAAAVGDAKLLPSPPFVPLPPDELAQVSFLRAKVLEKEGDKQRALLDYYRAATVDFGSNLAMTRNAMLAAMAIQKEDPSLEESLPKKIEMQALAFTYKNAFGNGQVPSEYMMYAVRPELPEPPAPKPAEEEAEKKEEMKTKPEEKPADGKAKGKEEADPKKKPAAKPAKGDETKPKKDAESKKSEEPKEGAE